MVGGDSALDLGWLPQLLLLCFCLFVLAEQGTSLVSPGGLSLSPSMPPQSIHAVAQTGRKGCPAGLGLLGDVEVPGK